MSTIREGEDGSAPQNLIDEETLARLIDECKEEESRLSVMMGPDHS